MAVRNPKKQFNFRVSIPTDNSLPIFSIQEFTAPDVEIEADEHGQGNLKVKTPGLITIGKATLSRIIPNEASDLPLINKYFWTWFEQAQSILFGGGTQNYRREVMIHELASDGFTVVATTTLVDAWVSKINGRTYKQSESGNLIEEVELSVDYVVQTP